MDAQSSNPYQSPEPTAENAASPTAVGLPDPAVHRLCWRCRRWFAPDDGLMVLRPVLGPLTGFRVFLAAVTGDEGARRFVCWRCLRVRRRNMLNLLLVWTMFAVVLGGALLYRWLRGW